MLPFNAAASRLNGNIDVSSIASGNFGKALACCWFNHVECLATVARQPLIVDEDAGVAVMLTGYGHCGKSSLTKDAVRLTRGPIKTDPAPADMMRPIELGLQKH
jgi:hypothetical protein